MAAILTGFDWVMIVNVFAELLIRFWLLFILRADYSAGRKKGDRVKLSPYKWRVPDLFILSDDSYILLWFSKPLIINPPCLVFLLSVLFFLIFLNGFIFIGHPSALFVSSCQFQFCNILYSAVIVFLSPLLLLFRSE